MRLSRSRLFSCAATALVVMLEAAVPKRVSAQSRAEMLPGLRFGPPLKAGAAVGVGFGRPMAGSPFAGPIALGEVGVGGARVSAGYLVAGEFASGIELLGSAIRTWGAPAQIEKNRTLLGGELRVSFFFVNAGIGVFRPTSRVGDEKRTRYYLNVGFGI
jgi:hypothetical protein